MYERERERDYVNFEVVFRPRPCAFSVKSGRPIVNVIYLESKATYNVTSVSESGYI